MKKCTLTLLLAFLAVAGLAVGDGANMHKYMVVNLSGGSDAKEYPVSYLDSEPIDGWSDEYKTVKLVLRLVKPGKFHMEGPWVKGDRVVALSYPYYIGVFEVTQAQYKLIMGSGDPLHRGDMRPMERVSWYTLRAGPDASDELKDACVWPVSDTVGENSFVGRIRRKTQLKGFDLPTEAQWEYASIGGGLSRERLGLTSEVLKFGLFLNKGGMTNAHCVVGSFPPNALGVYDMYGNVCEWCLDFLGELESGKFVDPLGAVSNKNDKRVLRGECFRTNITDKEEPSHYGYYANCWGAIIGFRIVCNMVHQGNICFTEVREGQVREGVE